MLCKCCNKSFSKEHYIECNNGHKYNCHVSCYKKLMHSIINDDLTLNINLIKCPVIECDSYLYSIPLRSMANILDDNIYTKAIHHWSNTFTGDTHYDDCGRTSPNNQAEFNHHCEQIYDYKNLQKNILFSTLGLKQRPYKKFIPREYLNKIIH